jgi:hypothetical protein
MSTVQFIKGDTVILSIEIRDAQTKALFDPTMVKITITKPPIKITDIEVIKVNEESMTKLTVGKYSYSYNSTESGTFNVLYKADNTSKITQSKDTFIVI